MAAAAAVALAVSAPLLTGGRDEPAAPSAVPSAAPSAAAVPAGQRAVSWHGVQLFVPEQWVLDDLHCFQPQSDTVVVPRMRNACAPPYVPGLTVVEYSAGTKLAGDGRPVEVSGHAGRRVTLPLTEEKGTREVLVLPDLDVTVSVRSPDAARARAILDTARVIEADVLGCPTKLAGTDPPEPDVPGAKERVLPGEPDRVVLCEYGDLRLERSAELPDDAVRRFQAVLDAAPVGPSPSRVGVTVSAVMCPQYDRAPLVLIATYADGAQLQIFTRRDSCTGPDPDNGARQVRVAVQVIDELIRALHEGPRR